MILENKYYVYVLDCYDQLVGPKSFKDADRIRRGYEEMGLPALILMAVVDEEGNLVNEQS